MKKSECGPIPLASSLHDFKSHALAEAYQDSDLTPVGVGYIDEIAAIKDMFQKVSPFKKVKRIAPYKSGHYYLGKLSRSERKKYLKNFKTNNIRIPLSVWLFSECLDSQDFLASAFLWADSSEGHDYWEKLDNRMRYIENLQKL